MGGSVVLVPLAVGCPRANHKLDFSSKMLANPLLTALSVPLLRTSYAAIAL